ncbi:MAG: hypothetical protein M1269_10695 [Chloroflexi bacterium]|nr:hypothetical protein [Chloroflexota bacterium]
MSIISGIEKVASGVKNVVNKVVSTVTNSGGGSSEGTAVKAAPSGNSAASQAPAATSAAESSTRKQVVDTPEDTFEASSPNVLEPELEIEKEDEEEDLDSSEIDEDEEVEEEEFARGVKGKDIENEGQTYTDESEEVSEARDVDLSNMSESEKYEYFQNLVISRADGDRSAWKTGEGELNLVGIRSFQDGKPGNADGNVYNDTIYAVYTRDGVQHVEAFNGSVDAGSWTQSQANARGFGYTDPQGNQKGISHIADGFYRDTWYRRNVLGETGLAQTENIKIHADSNADGIIQDNERLGADTNGDGLGEGVEVPGSWAIQFHSGGTGQNVNTWSAGCQVIRGDQYDRFKQLIESSPQSRYSYLVIDSSDLPAGFVSKGDTVQEIPGTGNPNAGQPYTFHGDYSTATTGGGTTGGSTYSGGANVQTPGIPTTDYSSTFSGDMFKMPDSPKITSPILFEDGDLEDLKEAAKLENMTAQIESQINALSAQAAKDIEAAKAQGLGSQQITSLPSVTGLYNMYMQASFMGLPISSDMQGSMSSALSSAGYNVNMLPTLGAGTSGVSSAAAFSGTGSGMPAGLLPDGMEGTFNGAIDPGSMELPG